VASMPRKIRWRQYKTAAGHSPVGKYLATLPDADAAEIVAGMKRVQRDGLRIARHLRGAIYEVRVDGEDQSYRILFAPQGRHQTIFLALEGFSKKTQQTPSSKIQLAEQRLRDWNQRGLVRRLRDR
jgi:phage-related protein